VLLNQGKLEFLGETEEAIDRYLKELETEQGVGRFQAPQEAPGAPDAEVRLEEAQITSAGEFSETGYAIGAPLEFRVTYSSRRTIPAPRMVVCVNNAFGQRITTLHSVLSNPPFAPAALSSRFTLQCRTSGIALAPGEYRLSLTLESAGQPCHIQGDAMRLRILPSDFHGNGGRYANGIVYCRQEWSLAD
jgi:hypothetical protein